MKKKRGVQRGRKGCVGVWRPVAPRHRELRGREVEDSADWRAQGASEKERKKKREREWAGPARWDGSNRPTGGEKREGKEEKRRERSRPGLKEKGR